MWWSPTFGYSCPNTTFILSSARAWYFPGYFLISCFIKSKTCCPRIVNCQQYQLCCSICLTEWGERREAAPKTNCLIQHRGEFPHDQRKSESRVWGGLIKQFQVPVPDLRPQRSGLGHERVILRPIWTVFRSTRAECRLEREYYWPAKADFRSERADIRS